jgi:short subunit fatty acids transporter
LGLFNSTQLEVRYESGTNNELIFQNGQIISTAFMGLFIAAFFVEIMMMRRKTDIVNPSSKKISKSKITKNKKSEISDKDKPSEEESKIEDDIENAKQLMKEASLTN